MLPDFGLTGKKVLITGSSRGLGKAMAAAFKAVGATVCIHGRDRKRVVQTAAELNCIYIVNDLATTDGLNETARLALDFAPDVLINNAGIKRVNAVADITLGDWQESLQVNVRAALRLVQACAPTMLDRQWGRIINISSIMATQSNRGRLVYSATKAALEGMTRTLAIEFGPYGITANCIAPGPMLTDMTDQGLTDQQQREFAARACLLRWGRPEEITGPALLLASEAGSYITGSTLVVDGGISCKTL